MKFKAKRLSVIAMVASVVLACVCLFAACGKKDYSAYTYTQYAKEDWDSKSISYQMYSVGPIQGPGTNVHILVNLYSDGGAAMFEYGLWGVSTSDAHAPYDYDLGIAYAWFGQWEKTGDEILVRLLGEDADDATVDMSAEKFETCNTNVAPGTAVVINGSQFKVDVSDDNLQEGGYYAFRGGEDKDDAGNTYALYWGDSEKIKGPIWKENEDSGELNGNEYMAVVTTPVFKTVAAWVAECEKVNN